MNKRQRKKRYKKWKYWDDIIKATTYPLWQPTQVRTDIPLTIEQMQKAIDDVLKPRFPVK